MSSVEFRKNEDRSRYEAVVDGKVAGFVTYEVTGDDIDLTHTVVKDGYEGQGVGSTLAKGALDDVRDQGKGVIPTCTFIKGYIEKHPVYTALASGIGEKGGDEPKGIGGGGSF
jgi:predicted GNAT family acetyltransferase